MGARNIAIAGLIGIDLLYHSLGDWRSSWGNGTVADAHASRTAAPHALWYNLDLVGHSILGTLVVGFCSRDLAVCWCIIDPLNSFNMLVFWSVDYYLTNDFIVNVAQRYFVNTTETPVYEPWGLAGFNRGRSETQLRLTYQF